MWAFGIDGRIVSLHKAFFLETAKENTKNIDDIEAAHRR